MTSSESAPPHHRTTALPRRHAAVPTHPPRRRANTPATQPRSRAAARSHCSCRSRRAAAATAAHAAPHTQRHNHTDARLHRLRPCRYDEDGGGSITISEFKQHFKKRNEDQARYDGKSKNFAQRRAARAGLDLATMVEPMFMALDKDQSGACMACACACAWPLTAAATRVPTFR